MECDFFALYNVKCEKADKGHPFLGVLFFVGGICESSVFWLFTSPTHIKGYNPTAHPLKPCALFLFMGEICFYQIFNRLYATFRRI